MDFSGTHPDRIAADRQRFERAVPDLEPNPDARRSPHFDALLHLPVMVPVGQGAGRDYRGQQRSQSQSSAYAHWHYG